MPPSDPPGGGDGGDIETRVSKLEKLAEKTVERLTHIERDIAVMKTQSAHYATKEDFAALRGETKGDIALLRGETKAAIADAKNSITMWVVSAILLAQLLPAVIKRSGF